MMPPLIWIERSDYLRLLSVRSDGDTLLRQEMARAIVRAADDMPAAVARVGDRIGYRLDDGPLSWGDLLLPNQAEGSTSVSVASPLGAALVGLRVGSAMDYLDERGTRRRLVVEHVIPA